MTRRNCNMNISCYTKLTLHLTLAVPLCVYPQQSLQNLFFPSDSAAVRWVAVETISTPVSHRHPPTLPRFGPEQCFRQDCVSVFESADVARVIDSLCSDLGKSCAAFQRPYLKIDIHYSRPYEELSPRNCILSYWRSPCAFVCLMCVCTWRFIISHPIWLVTQSSVAWPSAFWGVMLPESQYLAPVRVVLGGGRSRSSSSRSWNFKVKLSWVCWYHTGEIFSSTILQSVSKELEFGPVIHCGLPLQSCPFQI